MKRTNVASNITRAANESNLMDFLGEDQTVDPRQWAGLPAFVTKELAAEFTLTLRFRSREDVNKFADLIEQPQLKLCKLAKTDTWYPKLMAGERGMSNLYEWHDEESLTEFELE